MGVNMPSGIEKKQLVSSVANGHTDASISVIITIRDPDRASSIKQVYFDYKNQLEKTGLRYSFIFVLEGRNTRTFDELYGLKEDGENIKIVVFSKLYGEATALNAGFDQADSDILLTLPAYHQVDPSAIPSLIAALDENDMVVARRWPRLDSRLNRVQTRVFHGLLRKVLGVSIRDVTSSVRAMKRTVIEFVHMYGDQQRFFPILATRFGFKVKEIDVPQDPQDAFSRYFAPGVYIRRLLDVISLFFLIKFTAKPLRFFGLSGISTFILGMLFTLVLVVQRLYMGEPLADRPVLLFALLLVVLGVLLFAIGLIGELIIFVNARELKEYRIEKIVD